MRSLRLNFRASVVLVLAVGWGCAAAPTAVARNDKPDRKKPAKSVKSEDGAPELISRTGGGGETWSDVGELTAAANRGNIKAKGQLGELKLLGEHVEKDIPAGLALLEEAARGGEATAAFRLGKVYDDGALVARDRNRAFAYYRAAAAGGSPEAFFNLGAAHASGRGVRRDYTEALAWLILARKHGIQNDGEKKLRAQITGMKRPEWITAAESRAEQLAKELAERGVTGYLPGAETKTPGASTSGAAAPKPTVPPLSPPLLTPASPGKAPVNVERPKPIVPQLPGAPK